MKGYIVFYNNQKCEVFAPSLYDAKLAGIKHFKVPKSKQHLVTPVLAEQSGEAVFHTPNF